MAGARTSSRAAVKKTAKTTRVTEEREATKATKAAATKTKSAARAASANRSPGAKPAEGLRTKGGALLTPKMEADLVAEAEAGFDVSKLVPRKLPGRPSLSGHGGKSHRISVRVDDETFEMIQQVAGNLGRRPSELVREVLQAAYSRK